MPTFEFDDEKSAANLAKHGIDFVEAQALWNDPLFADGPTQWPHEPRRMRVAGLDGKLWSAIYTLRDGVIRLISVRRSRPKEAVQHGRQTDQR